MAAEPIKAIVLETTEEIDQLFEGLEEKQYQQELTDEYTQVHRDIAWALEAIMKNRLHTDTWLDVTDKLIILLSSKVSFVQKEDYDKVVTSLRDIRKVLARP